MVNQILLAKDVSYPSPKDQHVPQKCANQSQAIHPRQRYPHQPQGDRSYHSTLHASHQLALCKRRSLEMQATHHTITAHALIVLAKLHLVAHQWLYFLLKLTLAEALDEIATNISKQARLKDEYAIYICLYYVHLNLYFY